MNRRTKFNAASFILAEKFVTVQTHTHTHTQLLPKLRCKTPKEQWHYWLDRKLTADTIDRLIDYVSLVKESVILEKFFQANLLAWY